MRKTNFCFGEKKRQNPHTDNFRQKLQLCFRLNVFFFFIWGVVQNFGQNNNLNLRFFFCSTYSQILSNLLISLSRKTDILACKKNVFRLQAVFFTGRCKILWKIIPKIVLYSALSELLLKVLIFLLFLLMAYKIIAQLVLWSPRKSTS